MEKEPIHSHALLRFQLVPAEGVEGATINYIGIKTQVEGRFDVFFSDFDPKQFSLILKVEAAGNNQEYPLRPKSQVSFTANFLELVRFGGSEAPEAAMKPTERVTVDSSEVVYILAQEGDLLVELRQHPLFLASTPVSGTEDSEVLGGIPLDGPPLDFGDADPDTGIPLDEEMGGSSGGCALTFADPSTKYLVSLGWFLGLGLLFFRRFK